MAFRQAVAGRGVRPRGAGGVKAPPPGPNRRHRLHAAASPFPETAVADIDPPLFYRAHVFLCCNRRPEGHRRGSCAARGSEALRDYMKARAKELGLMGVRINQAGCLDRCEFRAGNGDLSRRRVVPAADARGHRRDPGRACAGWRAGTAADADGTGRAAGEGARWRDGVTAADTIFAPASGAGRAAITVVRLSGPRTGGGAAAPDRWGTTGARSPPPAAASAGRKAAGPVAGVVVPGPGFLQR